MREIPWWRPFGRVPFGRALRTWLGAAALVAAGASPTLGAATAPTSFLPLHMGGLFGASGGSESSSPADALTNTQTSDAPSGNSDNSGQDPANDPDTTGSDTSDSGSNPPEPYALLSQYVPDEGNWRLVPGLAFDDVRLSDGDAATLNIQGDMGSRAVLNAETGAAFDPDGRYWYFWGGGAKAYGGNEVYKLDLEILQITRMTEPSLLGGVDLAGNGANCPVPSDGPAASSTYDGVVWSPATESFFVFPADRFCLAGTLGFDSVWEFHPGTGLWSQVSAMDDLTGPVFAEYDPLTGTILVIDGGADATIREFDPETGEVLASADLGIALTSGSAVLRPDTGDLLLLTQDGVHSVSLTDFGVVTHLSDLPVEVEVHPHSGAVYDSDRGVLVLWDGGRDVGTFDPQSRVWGLYDNDHGPTKTAGGIFTKWAYIEKLDTFVGYHNASEGLWLYRLAAEPSATTGDVAPFADAGADQTVPVGTQVQLDGSSSHHPGNTPISSQWAFDSKPEGSSATLTNADTSGPTFVADVPGTYVIRLTVTDVTDSDMSGEDTVTIESVNLVPTADAGNDQTGDEGETVTLNGSGSSDPDGHSLTYAWTVISKPAGSAAGLSNASAQSPTLLLDADGDFVVELVVSDGFVSSAADTVTITARPFDLGTAGGDDDDDDGGSQNNNSDVIHIYAGDSFETAVENLAPGQTLIVHEGTYSDSGRISIQVNGTASAPVVIKGAEGEARPLITRPSSASAQNTINIEGGASYLTIKGLEITSNGGDGVKLVGGPSHITLEDLEIHDVDVGLSFQSNMNNITVRNNHIYNTGANSGTGEGMYIGCHSGNCAVSDSIFENNWVHDVSSLATQGDGIEIKAGSFNNIVRNNVIHDMNYPCIFVYGGGAQRNIVEGNVLSNCNEAMQVVSDAIVRNNIIFNSRTGITAAPHAVVSGVSNVSIVNNTLYGHSDECLFIRWTGATNNVLANNAVYCPGDTAVNASGLSGSGVTLSANYVEGAMSGASVDNAGFVVGGSAGNAFVDADGADFWLAANSVLRGAADPAHVPADDFNGMTRSNPQDVGAYETEGLADNPGWPLAEGFKGVDAANGNDGSSGGGTPTNAAPVADAGPDRTVLVGQTVTLDGSASSDPDGDSLSYAWNLFSKPGGSTATLSDPNVVGPSFVADVSGAYQILLTVSDGNFVHSVATTVIAADLPTANAGSDQTVDVGQTATLDGSGSIDPSGNGLTYSWQVTSRPQGSTAVLLNPTSISPRFAPDVVGTFMISLIVCAGPTACSAPDLMTMIGADPGSGSGNDGGSQSQGSVTLVSGGEFTGSGWKTNSATSKIVVDLGEHVSEGYVEFDVRGMRTGLAGGPNGKNIMLALWNLASGTNCSAPCDAAFMQVRFHTPPRHDGSLLFRLTSRNTTGSSNSYEGEVTGLTWDPNTWYTFRAYWSANLGAGSALHLNGSVISTGSQPNSVVHGGLRYLFIGDDNYKSGYDAVRGLEFRNVNVVRTTDDAVIWSHGLASSPLDDDNGSSGGSQGSGSDGGSQGSGSDGGGSPPPDEFIVVDDVDPRWLRYAGGDPFFLCGPGDPENFLYRGGRNADGTRDGDQMALIDKMAGTGANGIYMQMIRSHGGDGDGFHNPFIDGNPSNGLDDDILDQWETWFTAMDDAGILIYLFFFDDSASVWGGGHAVPDGERAFLEAMVNRFEHHKRLIWVIAEEYEERFSAQRASNMAAVIRAADDYQHPIAMHGLNGLNFSAFANDPNVDQFAIQYTGSASQFHSGMVSAWNDANGRYNLNMAEGHPDAFGADARERAWAVAMGGAYVMHLRWDIASTPVGDLEDCGNLVRFMETAHFDELEPRDDLAFAGTDYVLAKPGESYILYASSLAGELGVGDIDAGTYDLRWIDIASGTIVEESDVAVLGGDVTFATPGGVGSELAVWVALKDSTPPSAGSGGNDSGSGGTDNGSGGSGNTGDATISGTQPSNYVWDSLATGKFVYIDRAFTYSGIPTGFEGFAVLRTANDAKASSGNSFITFEVDKPVTVYVAHDASIPSRPGWLSGWTNTGSALHSNNAPIPLTLALYSRDFPAGTVTLGGNEGAGFSMYTVVVNVSGTSVDSGSGSSGNGGDNGGSDSGNSDDNGNNNGSGGGSTPPISGSSLSQLSAALAPGQFGALETNNINPVLGASGASGTVFGYADEVVWNPVTRQIQYLGGDHGDLPKFAIYEEATNTWRTGPRPSSGFDGTRHGYDHQAIDEQTGNFYVYQFRTVHTWDGAQWSQSSELPSSVMGYFSCCVGFGYFPERGKIQLASGENGPMGAISEYDPNTDTWSRVSAPASVPMGGYHNVAKYNPVHGVMLVGGGNDSDGTHLLRPDGTTQAISPPPHRIGIQASLVTVDPVGGDFLVLFADRSFWTYDPVSDNWTRQNVDVPVWSHWELPVHGMAATYISDYGVNMFITCGVGTCQTFLYKHTAGGGTGGSGGTDQPPPTPAPTVSLSANPSSVTLGDLSTLTWSFTDAASCEASDGWSGVKVTDGSQAVSPSQSTVYTLTCTGAGGTTEKSVTVHVSVNPDEGPSVNADADFEAACAEPDVILCRDFSTLPPDGWQGDEGMFINGVSSGCSTAVWPDNCPVLDNGRLRFTSPSKSSASAAGQYFVKFPADEIMPGESLYVRWEQEFDAAFLGEASMAGGGFKVTQFGAADQASCASNEIVFGNGWNRGMIQGYHACGLFEGFETGVPGSPYDINYQPGGPNMCLRSTAQQNNWFFDPDTCFKFVPGERFVFEVVVDLNPDPTQPSRVRLWATRDSRARELVIDYSRVLVDATEGYGAVWLQPYNTGKDQTIEHPDGHTWYDNLLIARRTLADN